MIGEGEVDQRIMELNDPDPEVRENAAVRLFYIKDPESIPALIGALDHQDKRIPSLAIMALEAIAQDHPEDANLLAASEEFTRCLECNTKLTKIEKEKIINRLPPKVVVSQNEFFICPKCQKLFWAGTHHQKMLSLVQKIKTMNFS